MPGNVFYRSPAHEYPLGVRGEGVYVFDDAGKRYLDGSGGAAVSSLGHGNARVVEAIRRQAELFAYAHTSFFTNQPQEALALKLADRFGQADARVFFLSGGSEANETAMKLARQYWVAADKPDKHIFISREQSYHGNTLATLSLSGFPGRKAFYQPLLNEWPKIAPCYAFRRQHDDESADEYAQRSANALETAILKAGPENVAAFFAETVSGATLGAVAAAPGYFKRIREICDQYEVLLILDEIMCGSGRTGTYFAFEQEGIVPDVVTLAKGLGAGYQPIGAVVCKNFIYEQIVTSHGAFANGHTYVGHATACAAGVAVQTEIDERSLLENVRVRGDQALLMLADAFKDHPFVGDIRGRGMIFAIELVKDRASHEAPAASLGLAASLKQAAMDEGLICYPGGGTADGSDGAHILLAPPFIYESEHVVELVDKLQAILRDVVVD